MASPAPDLPDECLAIRLDPGTPLVRVHHKDNGPVWFGPAKGALPGSRFDAPAGEFGTLYVADTLKGAFVETVLRKANRIVARQFVEQRAFSVLRPKRELTLVQVHGDGLIQLGVTSDICAGDDYGPSQTLALALRSTISKSSRPACSAITVHWSMHCCAATARPGIRRARCPICQNCPNGGGVSN